MNKRFAFVLALAAMPFAAVAGDKATGDKATGAEGRAGSSLFIQLDQDKDGFVSATEAKKSAEVTTHFKAIDVDGDSKISAQEMAAAQGK